MADDYVDDPYFGYSIKSLEHYAIATSPLLVSETGPRFYSDLDKNGGPELGEAGETPAPDSPEALGQDIRSVYNQIKGEQPGVADDMADHWDALGEMLFRTEMQLRDQTVMMAEDWESPAAKQVLLNEVGKTLAYLNVWMDAAYTNSTALRGLAAVMREAWVEMDALWQRWENAKLVSADRIELAGKSQGSNTEMEEDRKNGEFGDDSRSYEENLAAYSQEARVLASETATKYAPFIAQLSTARAVLLKPLNARMHPGASGMPWDNLLPPSGGPGGLPPGGNEKPPGGPGEPPPKAPPKDAPQPPPEDKLDKPPGEKPPPTSDLPPVPGDNVKPQNGLPPGTVPDMPPNGLVPPGLGFPNPTGLGPFAAPTVGAGPGTINAKPPAPPGGAPGDVPANTLATNSLANSGLFPPGTITPPPGGMPQQPNNAIGQRQPPGMPGNGLGAPPPGSAPSGGTQQAAKPNAQATPRAQETPEAFQVPPATTPPVLGAQKPQRPQRNRYSTSPATSRGPAGATPPVLANPRLAGATPKRPATPPWLRKTAAKQPDSELAAGVPTGTAPVLDGRLAPARPDLTELGADVPAALRGREPAKTAPNRKARKETQADRTTRVPQKTEQTTEAKPTPTNAWEVKTPGGPVVAGGAPEPPPKR